MTYYNKLIYALVAFVILSLVRPQGRKKAEKGQKLIWVGCVKMLSFSFPEERNK